VTIYGRSPWIDAFPKSRLPSYPIYRGGLNTSVVVVGGGLTGCTTAYALAAAGIKVALFEAERIGRGASGASIGWISPDPGVDFVDVERELGRRAARHVWQAWRRAALDFIALIRRLDLKCRLELRGALTVASSPEQAVRLKREHKARHGAGIETSIVNARAVAGEAAVAGPAALRTRDGATIDPYRASIGLAAAAAGRGAAIFERSPVKRITFGRRWAEVHTTAGAVRVERVVLATGVPTALMSSLIRHFWYRTTFMAMTERIPAAVRRQLGQRTMVIRDSAAPPHVIRWTDEERLIVSGADTDPVGARLRSRTNIQRTGQLMYELSTIYPDVSGVLPQYGWDAPYVTTGDGLPYIGPHRNYPHHLFAFGGASYSLTGAYLASRILLRHYLGEPDAADNVLGFRLEKRS
jgi:glycine/D-amino acid oxidase-like deaminating enzyme